MYVTTTTTTTILLIALNELLIKSCLVQTLDPSRSTQELSRRNRPAVNGTNSCESKNVSHTKSCALCVNLDTLLLNVALHGDTLYSLNQPLTTQTTEETRDADVICEKYSLKQDISCKDINLEHRCQYFDCFKRTECRTSGLVVAG